VIVKYRFPPKYRIYFPNMVALGLAFVAPMTPLFFAILCGAIAAALVKKYKPAIWERYGYPAAAGLTAGEACSGLLTAGLLIAGFAATELGTQIGCPPVGC
jgi:uncharacterized oligopeptide transporter (OPT) family protein